MSREILYKRPAATPKKAEKSVAPKPEKPKVAREKKEKAAPKPAKTPAIPVEYDSSVITPSELRDWIVAHPHFKWSKMVGEVGLDKANFHTKVLKAAVPHVKPEFLPKMQAIIENYGYKKTA